MTERVNFSFKLSNFADRISNSTDMTKKGANIAPSKLKAMVSAQGQGKKTNAEDSSKSRQIMENFVQNTGTGSGVSVSTP